MLKELMVDEDDDKHYLHLSPAALQVIQHEELQPITDS